MLVYIDNNRIKRFTTTRHARINEIITTQNAQVIARIEGTVELRYAMFESKYIKFL